MSLMDQPLIKSPTRNIGKSAKSSPLLQSFMSPMTPINDCLFNPLIFSVSKKPESVSECEQHQFSKSRENKRSSRRVHKVSMLRSKSGLLEGKCALLSPYSASSTTNITEKSYSTHSKVNGDKMLPNSTSDRLQPSSSKPNVKSVGSWTLLNGYHELITISPHSNQIGPLASRDVTGFVDNSVDDCSELFCTCPKSRCLKLYCVCFQRGLFCDNIYCKCIHCQNKNEYNGPDGARKAAITSILRRRHDAFEKREKQRGLGCNCKRNKCLKKYCACFSEGTICTYQKCGCLSCHNNHSKVTLTSNSPDKKQKFVNYDN
jgi:Tesmin/TSO1-like CXC domain, cysteine-rich domain